MTKFHCDREYWSKPPSGTAFCGHQSDHVLGEEDFKTALKTLPVKQRCQKCELHYKGSHFYAMAKRGKI
jgi:hypothetical protein